MFGQTSLIRRGNDPVGSLVDHFFDRSLFRPYWAEDDLGARSWVPSVDLRQNDDEYSVVVDLPGLNKGDVSLTIENDTLTISGERKFESEENKDNYNRIERSYGKFSRSFSLPGNVDVEKIKAKFSDGVLSVGIPKLETAKTRQIEIK